MVTDCLPCDRCQHGYGPAAGFTFCDFAAEPLVGGFARGGFKTVATFARTWAIPRKTHVLTNVATTDLGFEIASREEAATKTLSPRSLRMNPALGKRT